MDTLYPSHLFIPWFNSSLPPSYLCPGAAIPHSCWHTGTPITGFHLCWFFPDTVPSSFALRHPAPRQTHHLSLLNPWATLRWTLRHKVEGFSVLQIFLILLFYACVSLTVLDQLVKYQLVTHGPMLHSSLPCGRALELHSLSFTMLPWLVTQLTLLVLLPTPQSTEHYDKWRGERCINKAKKRQDESQSFPSLFVLNRQIVGQL